MNKKIQSCKLISKKTKNLQKYEIDKICRLKNQQWQYGLLSQKQWFKDNIKPFDIHNLFYINSSLVGYTALRKRTCLLGKKNKKKYFIFDTFIICKNKRKKSYSSLLMFFNQILIQKFKYFSILICKKNLIKFYMNFGWKKLNKKTAKFSDNLIRPNIMIFNEINVKNKFFFDIDK